MKVADVQRMNPAMLRKTAIAAGNTVHALRLVLQHDNDAEALELARGLFAGTVQVARLEPFAVQLRKLDGSQVTLHWRPTKTSVAVTEAVTQPKP